jgi:ubiquitin conjugation factor E4 B
VDPKKVSTDGYMINIQTILLRLFEPVMDVNFSKIDKVDVNYFRTSKRLDIKEETKIKATQEEANDYFAPKDGMDVDFGKCFLRSTQLLPLNGSVNLSFSPKLHLRSLFHVKRVPAPGSQQVDQ